MSSNIVHVMGTTCSGKSTFIDLMAAKYPHLVHTVEVGKALRAKYGESHFNGQAAPLHTQTEAWDIYLSGVNDGIAKGFPLVLVDGQPRDVSQAEGVMGLRIRASFLLFDARHEVRERRAALGRTGESLELARRRLVNDYRNGYVVLVSLLRANAVIRIQDTSDWGPSDCGAFAAQFVAEAA